MLTPDYIDLGDVPSSVDLFLAGGITNCPDWQADAIEMLEDGSDIVVANPRRDRLLDHEGEDAAYQIRWEYDFFEAGANNFILVSKRICLSDYIV